MEQENQYLSGMFAFVAMLIVAPLTGYLMSLCFFPHYMHFLAWMAFVPSVVLFSRLKPDTAAIFGIFLAVSYYCFCLAWLFEITFVISILMMFLWSLCLGVAFYSARMLMVKYGVRSMAVLVPLAIVGQELLRSETLPRIRFAYSAIGYSQVANLWLAQIASIGGVYFISFLIVLVNVMIALAIIKRKPRDFIAAAATMIIIALLGIISQPKAELPVTDDDPVIAAIQINTDSRDRITSIIERTCKEYPEADFLVLPEYCIADKTEPNEPFVENLIKCAVENNISICLGIRTEPTCPGACDFDNVAMLIHSDGTLDYQVKVVPIPFFSDGNPATTQQVFKTPYGLAGLFICYDGSFTDAPRRLVDKGAQFILAPIMHPNFWPDSQRDHQIDIARFRSIELRRYIARSCSTGISAIVAPDGRLINPLDSEQANKASVAQIKPLSHRTFFVNYGHYFTPILKIALALMVLLTLCGDVCSKFCKCKQVDVEEGC
ncbi:MAG: hypothetical protein K9M57_08160 [Phycisphaerae bacterium]|nr:hypothetical protein [Phycisphaerae bacterium]